MTLGPDYSNLKIWPKQTHLDQTMDWRRRAFPQIVYYDYSKLVQIDSVVDLLKHSINLQTLHQILRELPMIVLSNFKAFLDRPVNNISYILCGSRADASMLRQAISEFTSNKGLKQCSQHVQK